MSNKIKDLNEYKNNKEDIIDIPDELLNAYIKEAEANTPDLWSKIETGYEQEVKLIKEEKKSRNKKIVEIIAAGLIITLIAVPIIKFGVDSKTENNKKSDKSINYIENSKSANASDNIDYDESIDTSVGKSYTSSADDTNLEENTSVKTDSISNNNNENDATVEEYFDIDSLDKVIKIGDEAFKLCEQGVYDELPEDFTEIVEVENNLLNYPYDNLIIYKSEQNNNEIYLMYFDKYIKYVKEIKIKK